MKRIAVVIFNLGGPDSLEAVKPYLRNLFSDPAILALPNPFRSWLARFISWRREAKARDIYAKIGGKSPLLENTIEQAKVLEKSLGAGYKVFVAMRHWHPFPEEAIRSVQTYSPDQIVLLPLYPQFSTTTTGSFFRRWQELVDSLDMPTSCINSYPTDHGFVESLAELTKAAILGLGSNKPFRVLFSAHGLPKRVIEKGDPYQQQIEVTAQALRKSLAIKGLDSVICYQSRVGPLEWLGPSLEEEVKRAGREGVSLVVVPISFVSENSETVYELDIQYALRAKALGVPAYVRVPTVSCDPKFIEGLAGLVRNSASSPEAGLAREAANA